jgi:FAD/FMN-containing dehydrogenase
LTDVDGAGGLRRRDFLTRVGMAGGAGALFSTMDALGLVAGYDLPALLVGSEGTLGVITAVRLALVEAPARLVTAMLGAGSMGEAVELVTRARRSLPGLQAAELLDDAGMALVRAHLRLPDPLADAHPVYVLLETADDVEALADAVGDADDVAVADDTARREALWHYREALHPAVNAASVPAGILNPGVFL